MKNICELCEADLETQECNDGCLCLDCIEYREDQKDRDFRETGGQL